MTVRGGAPGGLQTCCAALLRHGPEKLEIWHARELPLCPKQRKHSQRHLTMHVTKGACRKPKGIKGLFRPLGDTGLGSLESNPNNLSKKSVIEQNQE